MKNNKEIQEIERYNVILEYFQKNKERVEFNYFQIANMNKELIDKSFNANCVLKDTYMKLVDRSFKIMDKCILRNFREINCKTLEGENILKC